MDCEPFDVDPDALVEWFGRQAHWKIETRRGYRNTIRSFYQWAYHAGYLAAPDLRDALPKVRASKPSPRPAPDSVWATAVAEAAPRTALMLRLASVGLRRGEVAVVSTDDVTLTPSGYELRVHGKGNKERVVPIDGELAALLLRGARGHTPMAPRTGWLFPGSDGGHLSPRWVGKLCSTAMPGVWTMHSLRHRCATRAFRGTRNIRAVQKLLGHESVATTEIYTLVEDDEVRAAMMAAIA
jgi:integrase